MRVKFGANQLTLREDSRKEEKIFFSRLETFKKECSQSKNLSQYLTELLKEVAGQLLRIFKAQMKALKQGFLAQA